MSKDDEIDDETGVLPEHDSEKLFHKIRPLDLKKSFTTPGSPPEEPEQAAPQNKPNN